MVLTEWKLEDALKVRWQEGVEDGIEKIVKTMYANGADVDTISKYTGLTADDVLKYCKCACGNINFLCCW